MFYNGNLRNAPSVRDRKYNDQFHWPKKNTTMFFWNVFGRESKFNWKKDQSFFNENEVLAVEQVVKELVYLEETKK